MMLRGPEGQLIRLTDERRQHIVLVHPEMSSLEWTIGPTLESPDVVLTSRNDPERVKEYYKEFTGIAIGKFVCVVVCFDKGDPFVLTAHGSRRLPGRGE